jgi:four helix bundle protein
MNKSFTSLDAWQKARKLASCTYSLTSKFPHEEMYGLTSQMRRSAVSVASNIAEGIGRNTAKDTIQFLYISRGSSYELETQLYISFDQNFINESLLNETLLLLTDCKKLINGLINYYESLIKK